MIAAFGMYDREETSAAHDRLWALTRDHLRQNGIAAPDALTRGELAYRQGWESDDLLLSQTCGLPFRSFLRDKVTLVGTPDYGLSGCAAGYYYSAILVRKSDPRQTLGDFSGARLAINEGHSQSGWAAALQTFREFDTWPGTCVSSGAHRVSAKMVAEGAADFCAIDAVTWRNMLRWDGFASQLRVLMTTTPTPALPVITHLRRDPEPVFAALSSAIGALDEADRQTLGLKSLVRIPAEVYLEQPVPAAVDEIFG